MSNNNETFYPVISKLKLLCKQGLADLPSPCTEHQLIVYLDNNNGFALPPQVDANLRLFYKHFLTMHCLYGLQEEAYKEGQYLAIAPLCIQLQPLLESNGRQSLSPLQAHLARYYLDLSHLTAATEDSVNDLLANFWRQFSAQDGYSEACTLLGVDANAPWDEIKRAYRLQIASAHPDKGGDSARFIELQQAFEHLRQIKGK